MAELSDPLRLQEVFNVPLAGLWGKAFNYVTSRITEALTDKTSTELIFTRQHKSLRFFYFKTHETGWFYRNLYSIAGAGGYPFPCFAIHLFYILIYSICFTAIHAV
jgi:hypothetical protein